MRRAVLVGLVIATSLPTIPAAQGVSGVRGPAAATQSREHADARIERRVPKLLRAKPLGHSVSVRIADAEHGLSYRRRSTVPRRPASNMKLVTAVTALHTMGAAATMPTTVTAGSGPRRAVLVAGGDPLLSSADLRVLAHQTADSFANVLPPAPVAAGTPTELTFGLAIDDTLYPAPSLAIGWPSFYVPSVVRPVRPLVRDLQGGWHTATDSGKYFSSKVDKYLAHAVGDREDLNIRVRYTGRAESADGAAEVARINGHTVGSALSYMLLVSDNNIAEMMYRNSAVAAGEHGTWRGGRLAAEDALRDLGVQTTGLRLVDGSGVSRSDRLTAKSLIQLLRAGVSADHPELAPLRGWLPVSGRSGTLHAQYGRFNTAPTSCARGKISAKTGTLHDVVALSGYTTGADGRLKVFSILVNNRPERYWVLSTRRAVDAIAATVTGCM